MRKLIFLLIGFLPFAIANAQNAAQDSTLNNLIHPPGYKACKLGELGAVKKTGHGKQAMILIPGIGFGGDIFKSFISHYNHEYTMYVITPAGFGGTAAPPMPDTATKYSALNWTNGIIAGILNLIKKEKLYKPIIVAHFVTGTQVALNLALNHPDLIGKVIVMGGSPYHYYPGQQKDGSWSDWEHEKKYTPEQRGKLVEVYWAPKWFKTVTKITWIDNNYTASDYCIDSTIGKQLVKTSSDVPLQVLIRYYLEYMTYDISAEYHELKVPVLVLIPDFNGLIPNDSFVNHASCAGKEYLKYYHRESWQPAIASANAMLHFKTIPDTRIFMWYDNPGATYQAIDEFIKQP